MADVYVDEAALQAIGSAIRSKNGLNTRYKPRAMAAAILSIPSTGGSATYFTVTMPSMVNQSFTVSVDGVARPDGYSFTAEKGSVITFTNPVPDSGYTAGELTVTGGSRLQAANSYCLTSDMTFTLTAATEEVVVSGFDLAALRSGEVLTVPVRYGCRQAMPVPGGRSSSSTRTPAVIPGSAHRRERCTLPSTKTANCTLPW